MQLFQAMRESKKGTSQKNILNIFQDAGSHKVNDNMAHKEKFSSMLSSYVMSDVIVKFRLSHAYVYHYTITSCACEFPSNKHIKEDSSIIDAPLEWDF